MRQERIAKERRAVPSRRWYERDTEQLSLDSRDADTVRVAQQRRRRAPAAVRRLSVDRSRG